MFFIGLLGFDLRMHSKQLQLPLTSCLEESALWKFPVGEKPLMSIRFCTINPHINKKSHSQRINGHLRKKITFYTLFLIKYLFLYM